MYSDYYGLEGGVEDAKIVADENSAEMKMKSEIYPDELKKKIEQIKDGSYKEISMLKNKALAKSLVVGSAIGFLFAIYKRKSIVFYSLLGGTVGALAGKPIGNFVTKIFSDEKW